MAAGGCGIRTKEQIRPVAKIIVLHGYMISANIMCMDRYELIIL